MDVYSLSMKRHNFVTLIATFIYVIFELAFAQPTKTIDDGRLALFVLSNGSFGYDPNATRESLNGLYYPRDSFRGIMAGGGIWVAGIRDSAWRVTVSADLSEFVGGPISSPDTLFPVYKITRGENYEQSDDYQNWPILYGAPTDPFGKPLIRGSQCLYTMFNDADTAAHIFAPFTGTLPLGVEAKLYAYTWDDVYQIHDTLLTQVVFFEYTVINRTDSDIDSCVIAAYADPDIGFADTDRLGTSAELRGGYIYESSNFDGDYGPNPPVVGMIMLDGNLAGVNYYYGCRFNYTECIRVDTLPEVVNLLHGRRANGLPYFDPITSLPTTFPFDGNPVDSTGWIADLSRDYRMLLFTRPNKLAAHDSAKVKLALIVTRGESTTKQGIAAWTNVAERLHSLEKRDTLSSRTAVFPSAAIVRSGKQMNFVNWGGRLFGGGVDLAKRYLGYGMDFGVLALTVQWSRGDQFLLQRYVPDRGGYVYRGPILSTVYSSYLGPSTEPTYHSVVLDLDGDGAATNQYGKPDPIIVTTFRYGEPYAPFVNSLLSAITEQLWLAVHVNESPDDLRGTEIMVADAYLSEERVDIIDSNAVTFSEPPATAFAERTVIFENSTDFVHDVWIDIGEPQYLSALPSQLALAPKERQYCYLRLSGSRRESTPISFHISQSGYHYSATAFRAEVDANTITAGDTDFDGVLDFADIIRLVQILYRNAPTDEPLRLLDANCDSRFDLVDIVIFVNYLLAGEPAPCDPNQ